MDESVGIARVQVQVTSASLPLERCAVNARIAVDTDRSCGRDQKLI